MGVVTVVAGTVRILPGLRLHLGGLEGQGHNGEELLSSVLHSRQAREGVGGEGNATSAQNGLCEHEDQARGKELLLRM